MRMVRNVAMALVVLASATMANAASFVWYETANVNGNGAAGAAGGAQGTTLNLNCDTSGPAGSCSWVITMRAALGAGGITGYSADLRTASAAVSASNAATAAGNPFNNPVFPGTPGSGLNLMFKQAGQSFVPIAPQTLSLHTFTLTKNFTTGEVAITGIQGGPSTDGQIVWGNDAAADYETVGFGPNPATPGLEGTLGALPVITITPTPEPASLSLLALGALAVIRRRAR